MKMLTILRSLLFLSLPLYWTMPVFASDIVNKPNANAVFQPLFAGFGDVGGGRKMYMECRGVGIPTVVLISGLADRADIWHEPVPNKPVSNVLTEISKFTRVCAYDRPGTVTLEEKGIKKSRSNPVKQPVTIKDAVIDLHALLIASNEPGPYVLVGHSAGGLIARLYASQYPKNVSGIVLVDALSEGLHKRLSKTDWIYFNDKLNGVPKVVAGYKEFERIDIVRSFKQLRPVPQVPTIVITADKSPDFASIKAAGRLPEVMPPDFPNHLWSAQIKAQNDLAKRFPHAKHIKHTNSGHYIHIEQPQIVTEAILEIINTIRKH